jgi:hypothetical protein
MGDSGEGLIDAEARIQERIEELQRERRATNKATTRNPEAQRELDSLKLARTQLERQLNTATHTSRKTQLMQAIEEIDRRIAATSARL